MLHPDQTSPEMRRSPPFCNEGFPMCQLGGDRQSLTLTQLQLHLLARYGLRTGLAAIITAVLFLGPAQ